MRRKRKLKVHWVNGVEEAQTKKNTRKQKTTTPDGVREKKNAQIGRRR